MKTSLDTETNISLCGVKNPISKMESFNGEEKHVCISGESMTCAPLSDKEIQEESHNESYPKSRRHVKTIDDTQKEETERRYSPSELQFSYSDNHVKDKVLRVQDDSQDFTTFEDSRLVEFDFDKECTEDDPPSDVDDTAKECLRIFNEFTRSKAHKGETAKQPSGKQMELDMQYYQNISGPKRRIAHTAKFDAKIEDKAIYECCSRRNMYVNIARNTLKKLRDQDVSGSSNNNKTTGLKKNEKKNEKRSLGLPWCRSG
ncbi:uncharacterized protein LOC114883682 isoform X3 [Monodon monoceros]|uniref:uncharacterized protein LOC114883682 isoform X3 n=1 Tax=Monodon monoceros TaxID=40151 RepID=UPI0010F51413|nr:uncharacterized protein LOC114883682 isoform X3 [Monodon monoceros]